MGDFYKVVRYEDNSSFFKRHSSWFTFIGALIVFMTFITKEALRDNLKEVVISIEAAQSLDISRADSAGIVDLLRDFEDPPAVFGFTYKNNQVTDRQLDATMDQLKRTSLYIAITTSEARSALDRTSDLERQLSRQLDIDTKSPKIHHSLEEIEVKRLIGDEHLAVIASARLSNVSTKNKSDLVISMFHLSEQLNTTANDADVLKGQATTLLDTAITEAEHYHERRERQYHWATWSSYLLYTLGWGLGLVGRLYGEEDLLASD